jgi:hypothetical protein
MSSLEEYLDFVDPDGAAFWRRPPDAVTLAVLALAAFAFYPLRETIARVLTIIGWFDLMLHEAGHPIFGLFGSRWLMFAGGTLMQLLWPILCYGVFLRQSNPKSADFCIFWFGTNFIGIGPYIADARAQVLPLIGGGEHDWAYLLGSAGLLEYDAKIGAAATWFGLFAMIFSAYTLFDHLKNKKPSGPLPGDLT